MQPLLAATSTLESRLAEVSMGELLGQSTPESEAVHAGDTLVDREPTRDADAYASIAVVPEPPPVSDFAKTKKFLRDTTEHFVTTINFAREALDADDSCTARFIRYSTPYEKIEIEAHPKAFVRPANEQVAKTSGRVAAVVRASDSKASMRSTDADTLPYVQYSAPYERIDIQEDSRAFVRTSNEEMRTAKAAAVRASELVAIETIGTSGSFEAAWFAEAETIVIEDSAPTTSRRPISVPSLLVAAFTLGAGVGLALFAI
jgi:hypothetical protein